MNFSRFFRKTFLEKTYEIIFLEQLFLGNRAMAFGNKFIWKILQKNTCANFGAGISFYLSCSTPAQVLSCEYGKKFQNSFLKKTFGRLFLYFVFPGNFVENLRTKIR